MGLEKEEKVFDVTTIERGDVVYYLTRENGRFIIETGLVKDSNYHKDGVEVVGDGWKQYVSKWFICKVERSGEVIFIKDEELFDE